METLDFLNSIGHIKRQSLSVSESLYALTEVMTAYLRGVNQLHFDFPPVSKGLYGRFLLNSFADDFQVIAALWESGASSPIHDHQQTIGAVAAIKGEVLETKYTVDKSMEDKVHLRNAGMQRLIEKNISPILPGHTMQVHKMFNGSRGLSMTMHVYLNPVKKFHFYEPVGEGIYKMIPQKLWFEKDMAWSCIKELAEA